MTTPSRADVPDHADADPGPALAVGPLVAAVLSAEAGGDSAALHLSGPARLLRIGETWVAVLSPTMQAALDAAADGTLAQGAPR